MAFKPKTKQPEFASLKTVLAQSDVKAPLYQTIQLLIERLMQMQGVTLQDIADINASINDVNTAINVIEGILKLRTFITLEDETLYLPNSYQVLPGTNITFDTSVDNQLTINASGGTAGAYYDSPLSDGDLSAADLIFANGECIICQVPNVP